MTTAIQPIPERVALLDEIDLLPGGHPAPPEDCTHPLGCSEEICSWALGLEWSDHPEVKSPVITAFRRSLNDRLSDDLRQKLKPSLFWGIGTADDGLDEQRAWMCADWTIRMALPTWLELAGTTDAAATLRSMPAVTADTIGEVRPLLNDLRQKGRKARDKAYDDLRSKVRKAVEKKLKAQGASNAGAAGAAGAAEAAEAAEAAGAAWAAAGPSLRAHIRKVVREAVEEKLAPTQQELFPSALDLLKRMCELEASSDE